MSNEKQDSAMEEKTGSVLEAEVKEAIKGAPEEGAKMAQMPPQNVPTEDLSFPLTQRQKDIILPAIEERRAVQAQLQAAGRREGEIAALIADTNGVDGQITKAGVSEDGNSIIFTVVATPKQEE